MRTLFEIAYELSKLYANDNIKETYFLESILPAKMTVSEFMYYDNDDKLECYDYFILELNKD